MPSVLIEVRRQYTQEQEIALMEAVHMALREAFKIVPGDKNVRLVVHEPHRFAYPPLVKNQIFTRTSVLMHLLGALLMRNEICTKPS